MDKDGYIYNSNYLGDFQVSKAIECGTFF